MADDTSIDTDELLDRYAPPEAVYDEMLVENGVLRPCWEAFCRSLQELGSKELSRRWRQAQQTIRQTGIVYSGQPDTENNQRPWLLDPIPILIEAAEWRKIGEALEQRAQLLNVILADLYGPQQLIRQGNLPPELLYMHPGFRRPYHGQRPPGGRFLHVYAADLGRSPNGAWWILGDRTEAPSGAGYALENRIVLSRMLPDLFHRSRVERLAHYFIALRDTLLQLASTHRDNPRIALLSQGPDFSNYFEDAYLARYLGYTLVVGEDLAVRNSQVMLKTLSGLLPVDVVLRRPNSEDCDPLELAQTTSGGIAGLLQAARDRQIVVANTLGSGILESPVFMAFLPQLCKTLLGEELKLPGVATWWCGDPTALDYVANHIDDLIIKRAFRQRGRELDACQKLNTMPKQKLIETIRANPTLFVAQERVLRSTAPLWQNGTLSPAHIAIRTFVVASSDSYVAMKGGFARVSKKIESLELSLLTGEGSKDVWVLSDGTVSPVTLLHRAGRPLQLQRGGAELPSRVADNLFWLGRHLERADFVARLVRAVCVRLTSETESEQILELPMLMRALAEFGQVEPGFVVEGLSSQLPAFEDTLPSAVLDENQAGNLRSLVDQIGATVSKLRDRISVDGWYIVNRIREHFRPLRFVQTDIADLLVLLNELISEVAAFGGLVNESMTRSQAWRFLEMGRRLERASQLVALTKCAFGECAQTNDALLEATVEITDSMMTYRSRYLATIQLGAVLDLLLTDQTNPRSVEYQLEALVNHINMLPRDRSQVTYSAEQKLAMSALHMIRMADAQSLADAHAVGDPGQLNQLLETLEEILPELSDAIAHRYLIHVGPAHQLAAPRPE